MAATLAAPVPAIDEATAAIDTAMIAAATGDAHHLIRLEEDVARLQSLIQSARTAADSKSPTALITAALAIPTTREMAIIRAANHRISQLLRTILRMGVMIRITTDRLQVHALSTCGC